MPAVKTPYWPPPAAGALVRAPARPSIGTPPDVNETTSDPAFPPGPTGMFAPRPRSQDTAPGTIFCSYGASVVRTGPAGPDVGASDSVYDSRASTALSVMFVRT